MAANDKRFQKCKERRKKFLTNEIGCGKIPNVPQVAERVSCKLNNEDVQLKKLGHWGSVNYPVFEQEFMKLWK